MSSVLPHLPFPIGITATTPLALTPEFAAAHPEWLDTTKGVSAPISLVTGGKYVAIRIDQLEMLRREWHGVQGGLAMVGNWQPVGLLMLALADHIRIRRVLV